MALIMAGTYVISTIKNDKYEAIPKEKTESEIMN